MTLVSGGIWVGRPGHIRRIELGFELAVRISSGIWRAGDRQKSDWGRVSERK